jgi:hypothetical protein
MQRDFSSAILGLNGKPVRPQTTIERFAEAVEKAVSVLEPAARAAVEKAIAEALGEPLTLGMACADALVQPVKDEGPVPVGDARKRLALALKIGAGGKHEIEPADRDLMKERVSRYFVGALIPGRVDQLLEAEESA